MTSQDFDKEELEVFLNEMEELLQILEEDIIKLEKQPDNPSVLAEIFRAAHTIKGSAGSMGFAILSELAHSMETVFDGVRSGSIRVSMDLIDIFLRCTDSLKKIKDEISKDCKITLDTKEDLEALRGLMTSKKKDEGKGEKQGDTATRETPAPAPARKKMLLRLDAASNCQMPFVRAFQALTFFSEIGDIIYSAPSVKDIEDEVKAFPMKIVLSTAADRKKVEETLALISGVILIEYIEGVDMDVRTPATAETSAPPEETIDSYEELEELAGDPEPPAEAPPAAQMPVPEPTQIIPAEKTPPKKEPEVRKDIPDEKKKIAGRTVRVDVERMDAIMDLVGELVINRTRLSQLTRALETFNESDENVGYLTETSDNIELISSQLQENIMKARLLPIENVFNKFPRMVRDLANKSKKKIDLVIEGEKTELDRSVLEEIGDPLMHALRNSIDHGIGTPEEREKAGKPANGRIKISASHVEDHILIVIEDDGKGIDPQKVLARARQLNIAPPETLSTLKEQDALELVFLPGFSTKETVSEVSGRGVGMDVVRTNIKKLNGNVSLQSTPGVGTKVIIKLPLTLAIIKSLLVTMGRRIFAIPLISVVQTLRVDQSEIQALKGKETILFRGSVLPLIRLGEVLGLRRGPDEQEPDRVFIVVVSWAGRRVGIIVDSLIGDQEIVIRPLGEYIGEVPGISGAAILGDGRITLIIDVGGFIKMKLDESDTSAKNAGVDVGA